MQKGLGPTDFLKSDQCDQTSEFVLEELLSPVENFLLLLHIDIFVNLDKD